MDERINEREIICTICPNSCRLSVWRDKEGELHISGNKCNRGLEYGRSEYTNPERMLITTMRIEGGILPVVPVRSEKPIPKEYLLKAVKIVNENYCDAPVKMGDVVLKNILGTNVNVIASRDLPVNPAAPQSCSIYDEMNADEIIQQTLLEDIFGGKRLLSEVEKYQLEEAKKHLLDRLNARLR